jgi:predicted dinucleotide-utilizing enzyme
MKKFDKDYKLLDAMYQDGYFPDFLVDKIKELVQNVIAVLETGERNSEKIQSKFDEMTLAINDLQEEFEENDSEIETAARESIGETVEYILKWFDIDIDAEDAIGERDW